MKFHLGMVVKVHFVKRDVTEMKKGIRPIRIRAGLPDYDNVQGHETAL